MLHPEFHRPEYYDQFDKHILNYQDESGSFEYDVVHENVIHIRLNGVISERLANRSNECMLHIMDILRLNGVEPCILFIFDMRESEYSETSAYRIMRNHSDHYFQSGSYRFNALISDHLLIKLYVNISNRYRKRPMAAVFNSREAAARAVWKKLQTEEFVPLANHRPFKLTFWDRVLPWRWYQRMVQLKRENQQIQLRNEDKYERLVNRMKSIMYLEPDSELSFPDEQDEKLQEIYRQMNTMRMEVQVSIDELRRTNNNLERIIRERISKDRKSRAFLLSSIEQTEDQVWSFDMNGRYLFFNKAHEKACKSMPAVGHPIESAIPPELAEQVEEHLKALQEGTTCVIEMDAPEHKRISTTLSPVYENERVIGVTALSHDISEVYAREKFIKDKEAELSALMNSTEDFMFSVDQDFRVVKVNNSLKQIMHELSGRVPMRGDHITEMWKLPDDLSIQELKKQVALGSSVRKVIPMNLKGRDFFVDICFSPIRDTKEQVTGVAITARDVTHMRKVEQELRHAKSKADEMIRLKSNFLASMSHEVRTPINGILTAAQLMQQHSPSQEICELLELQLQSGNRMLNTINSLLHLSKLESEAEQEDYDEVNLDDIIIDCLRELRVLADPKGLEVTYQNHGGTCLCLGQNYILRIVMMNVISNAVKYTEKGTIRIDLRKRDGLILVDVMDTGIGISKEHIEDIFRPYKRSSEAGSREGSGLGLSIVTRYLQLLGGDIFVESTPNEGSTFKIELPAYEPPV